MRNVFLYSKFKHHNVYFFHFSAIIEYEKYGFRSKKNFLKNRFYTRFRRPRTRFSWFYGVSVKLFPVRCIQILWTR